MDRHELREAALAAGRDIRIIAILPHSRRCIEYCENEGARVFTLLKSEYEHFLHELSVQEAELNL